jgi:hypothetical protein
MVLCGAILAWLEASKLIIASGVLQLRFPLSTVMSLSGQFGWIKHDELVCYEF